jgi:hypothetical protein
MCFNESTDLCVACPPCAFVPDEIVFICAAALAVTNLQGPKAQSWTPDNYNIPATEEVKAGQWKVYTLDMPVPRPFRVTVLPAVAGSIQVILCPECPDADGGCQGKPRGHYNARTEEPDALAKMLWNARPVNDKFDYPVGVNDLDLLRKSGKRWYVAVKTNHATNTLFAVETKLGKSVCSTFQQSQRTDVSGGCSALVDYQTLDVSIGDHGALSDEVVRMTGRCPEIDAVWCKSTHPMCDADGFAVKACPSTCQVLQSGCAALNVNATAARVMNREVCDFHGSHFGAQNSCFPKPVPPPIPCSPVHFTCETPECYLTSRPINCICKPRADKKEPECQISLLQTY